MSCRGCTGCIQLAEQERRYEAHWRSVVDLLRLRLADPAYLRHLHDLGLERLRAGYRTYGDAMYRWDSACRDLNMDEELADYIVYGTSEP